MKTVNIFKSARESITSAAISVSINRSEYMRSAFWLRFIMIGLALVIVGGNGVGEVMAQNIPSLGDVGNTVKDQGEGISNGVHVFFVVAGLVMVGIGLMQFTSETRSQQKSKTGPITLMIVGSLLLIIEFFIQILQVSTVGEGAIQENDFLRSN